jgi:hypothetical protein
MPSTSMVITGEIVMRSSRCIMPPLMAPGSLGIWVCSSTAVVLTVVYSLSPIGIVWRSQPKIEP